MKISFTGHRKIVDFQKINEKLKDLNLSQDDEFYVGGATGFDFLVLKFLLSNGFKHIKLCIPFKGFEKYMEKDSENLKEMQNIHYSGKVDVLEFNSVGKSFADKTKARNQFMVNQADIIFCYWDGNFKSGTAQTVRMAQKRKIKVVNLF